MSKCPYYVMINDAMQSEGTEHTVMSLILTKIVREYVLGKVVSLQSVRKLFKCRFLHFYCYNPFSLKQQFSLRFLTKSHP